MKDARLYLIHIEECLARIQRYTSVGKAAFEADTMIQDAVMRNLQTLAEATQRLPEAIKARRPELDWRGMAAFRNVIVHNYLGIDLNQVWRIIEQDLPALGVAMPDLLEERES